MPSEAREVAAAARAAAGVATINQGGTGIDPWNTLRGFRG
jgi:hypothetical protein